MSPAIMVSAFSTSKCESTCDNSFVKKNCNFHLDLSDVNVTDNNFFRKTSSMNLNVLPLPCFIFVSVLKGLTFKSFR